tara:strand:- start:260 stop:439 length:180 start_codon:yes stop_codon:yes gene_type:complete
MKNQELSDTYEVRVGGSLVFSGELDDAMDTLEDLSEEYYRTGEPDPSTITMELVNGSQE